MHLKVDTGMGRMGLSINNLNKILNNLVKYNNIIVEGIYSHFSTSDEIDVEYRDFQLNQFDKIILEVKKKLPGIKYFHIANSAAVLTCSKSWYNMIRPGLSIYGISPLGQPYKGLLPVMQVQAPIVLIKNMEKDSFIGYGRQYKTKTNEKLLIIQAGYADGIPMEFSNNGKVEINNILYDIKGKVSMDLIAVHDHIGNIKMGDEAIFWGSELLRLEKISKEFCKIPYQLLTSVSKRFKREYIYV